MIVGMIVAVTERDYKLLSFIQEHANYEGAGPLSTFSCLHVKWRLIVLTKKVEFGEITMLSDNGIIGVI